MKAVLLGWEPVSYNKKGTEEKVEGLNLHVGGPNPKVTGLATETKWVNKHANPELYAKIISWPMHKSMNVNLVQETIIGSKYPVLTDVVPLDDTKEEHK